MIPRIIPRLPRAVRWCALALTCLVIASVGHDAHPVNPAQRAATPYAYDLVAWEIANFLDKWTHKLGSSLPWNGLDDDERLAQVDEYFRLGREAASIRGELARAAAEGQLSDTSAGRLEERLEDVISTREVLRQDVEETIESTVSAVVSEIGIGTFGDILLPPVDIRLTEPPRLLVTSPRDRVERTHDVLLDAGISVSEQERIESELLEDEDLSALVVGISGLATYPASLINDRPLRSTLRTSAHEWMHHYFFFRPLGQRMFYNSNMQTLNETAADIAGREIGDMAFEKLGGVIEEHPPPAAHDPPDEPEFKFDVEMRETRKRVDELLSEGRIEEAEAYMEERRLLFVENGRNIRKLNQAYFAFHGTYAESPTSASPIGDQLNTFRELSPDLATFIREVSQVSSYTHFLRKLARLEAERSPPR